MNITHFEHAFYAVLMQLVIGLLTGNWWAVASGEVKRFLGKLFMEDLFNAVKIIEIK